MKAKASELCSIWFWIAIDEECKNARFGRQVKVSWRCIYMIVGADARAVRPYMQPNRSSHTVPLIINGLHLAFPSQPFCSVISPILHGKMGHIARQERRDCFPYWELYLEQAIIKRLFRLMSWVQSGLWEDLKVVFLSHPTRQQGQRYLPSA